MAQPATDATTVPLRTPVETVEAFLDALQALDVDRARALMSPDIAYRNVPYPTARGPRATEAVLKGFLVPFTGFEVQMLSIAADGPTVLTERIDTLSRGRFRLDFWVCGTFEVHDGLITVWRDRFDHLDMAFGLVKGLALAPFR